MLRGAVKALAQPRRGALAGVEFPSFSKREPRRRPSQVRRPRRRWLRAAAETGRPSRCQTRVEGCRGGRRRRADTLPPALVASQLRAVVSRLPADFVRQEAVTVGTLPSKELVDAAAALVDASRRAFYAR